LIGNLIFPSFIAPTRSECLRSPEDDESDEEAEALERWAGEGAVRLLRRDPARRALLIERAGDDISELAEEEATGIAVATGLKLWRPAAEPFRWIGDHVPTWLDSVDGHALAPLARELYASLDVSRETLVHGDFHHHNILRSARGPLAIDPKPMLGEPEYDVPSYLWNPLSYRMRRDVTERRLAAFAPVADAKTEDNGHFDDGPESGSKTDAKRRPTLWIRQLFVEALPHRLQEHHRNEHAECEGEEHEGCEGNPAPPPPVNQGHQEIDQQNDPDKDEK
jgi:hypothetical protein